MYVPGAGVVCPPEDSPQHVIAPSGRTPQPVLPPAETSVKTQSPRAGRGATARNVELQIAIQIAITRPCMRRSYLASEATSKRFRRHGRTRSLRQDTDRRLDYATASVTHPACAVAFSTFHSVG
jgi:hypothetical protein